MLEKNYSARTGHSLLATQLGYHLMKMLAFYDIANHRRLMRVAKIFKDYGTRVQYSKFEIELLSDKEFATLQKRISDVIEDESDGVKFIPLCERCRNCIEVIGKGKHIDPDNEFYII